MTYRDDAMAAERRAATDLQLAAAMYAANRSQGALRALGEAAVRWHSAADDVLDAILCETEGRDLTPEERTEAQRVIPTLRIVKER